MRRHQRPDPQHLVDPTAATAPAAYGRRVARALGTAYEQWRDHDLLTALGRFTETAVHSDAWVCRTIG
jgi:hypothetical protein